MLFLWIMLAWFYRVEQNPPRQSTFYTLLARCMFLLFVCVLNNSLTCLPPPAKQPRQREERKTVTENKSDEASSVLSTEHFTLFYVVTMMLAMDKEGEGGVVPFFEFAVSTISSNSPITFGVFCFFLLLIICLFFVVFLTNRTRRL